jgi:hypothetical protein
MATPMSPGWYPAPDGRGQQWWNGAGWSESRRNADGTSPGLPGYQAAPPAAQVAPVLNGTTAQPGVFQPVAPSNVPAPQGAPNPYAQPGTPLRATGVRAATNPAVPALILGGLGVVVWPPLGIIGLVLGILALRKPGTNRTFAMLAIGLGAISVVIGIVQIVLFAWGVGSINA